MWLSLSHPCFSGTLLMLLVLNLHLWEKVASVPMHARLAGHGEMSLKDLLDHAITLSQNIRELSAEMHRIFLEDLQYTSGWWIPERDLTGCHTSAFAILIPQEGPHRPRFILDSKKFMCTHTGMDWHPCSHLMKTLAFFALYNLLQCLTKDSWTMLMLLVSNLLLRENIAFASMDVSAFGNDEVSLKDRFDDAIILSKNVSELATKIQRLFRTSAFSSDMFLNITLELLRDQELLLKTWNSCHTFSLNTPETKEEAKKISLEDFLKMILSILHAWNNPLHHLLEELSAMPGAPEDILSRVEDIEVKIKELQESIMRIVSTVHPGIEGNEEYPVWSELASLQSMEEKSRFFALYKLSYCLRVDTDKANTYLRLLRCVHVHGDICYNLED